MGGRNGKTGFVDTEDDGPPEKNQHGRGGLITGQGNDIVV